MDIARDNLEKNLEVIGEKMGHLMKDAPLNEKEILKRMNNEVRQFAEQEEKNGKYFDKSAIFAAGIISNADITNQELKKAAKEYIETDYLFIKSFKSEEN